MTQAQSIAVVLFNLGGPDSKEAIRPFLLNFFMDPNIIRVPYPLRWLIARLIAARRSRREAGDSYGELGNRSPLLENSLAQATALEAELNARGPDRYQVHVCMRYWHPMADAVVDAVRAQAPDRIVLVPLYPQFSTTTTWSSLGVWLKACRARGLDVPSSMVCCYPLADGYIDASADLVRTEYNRILAETGTAPRVLFSAHGLPESVIRSGDPYQHQCELSAQRIAERLNIPDLDWVICYQSRVGPQKWIGPSTEQAIEQAAADKVPVVIYPHAFVNEHVETLVELDIEYREMAEHAGIAGYGRAGTVSTHPLFIAGLADMVQNRQKTGGMAPAGDACICGKAGFTKCPMAIYKNLDGADRITQTGAAGTRPLQAAA